MKNLPISWPPEATAIQLCELAPSVDVLAAFERLRIGSHPWLLDSSGAPGEPSARLARHSFAGSDPYLVLRAFGTRSELAWRTREACTPGRVLEGPSLLEGEPLDVMRSLLPPVPGAVRITTRDGACDLAVDDWPPFLGGAVGAFGYELAREDQPVRPRGARDLPVPDLVLLFVDRLLAFDHATGRAFSVGLGFGGDLASASASAARVASDLASAVGVGRVAGDVDRIEHRLHTLAALPREDLLATALPADADACFDEARYTAAVEHIKQEIECGNVYQANLTQRLDLPVEGIAAAAGPDFAWEIYRALRRLSPAPFAAYIELPEVAIVSSSPERFLRLDRSRRVESRPIKGTRPRGVTPDEDQQLAKELAESPKDRAENLMIVDLVRNDLGRVCEIGSVEVPELMTIERYATVHQMVSSITGRLREDRDRVDLIRATFPPGSMTGAPKLASMRVIDALEPVRRGIYAGAIGYLDALGGLDLSVVIRTLLVHDGVVVLHSGGAVVSDSCPKAEYRESLDKIRALLAAVAFLRGAHEARADDATMER